MKGPLSDTLRLKLEALPTGPGVYRMKDEAEKVLYVGKAKSLRSRVRSYFQESGVAERGARIEALVARVADVDCIVTETEGEALILEASQIKAHHPRYNINLKDDKKYPFIRITDEAYPRIFWTRDLVRDGSRYLGPYSNARHMRTMLDVMHKVFPCAAAGTTCPTPRSSCAWNTRSAAARGPARTSWAGSSTAARSARPRVS